MTPEINLVVDRLLAAEACLRQIVQTQDGKTVGCIACGATEFGGYRHLDWCPWSEWLNLADTVELPDDD